MKTQMWTMTGMLTVSLLFGPIALGTTPATLASAGSMVFLERQFDAKTPEAVLGALWEKQRAGPLTFQEQMDTGIALVLENKPNQAAGVFQTVAAYSRNKVEKAAALVYAAQSFGLEKRWHDAGETANRAGQLIPQSKAIAALRFTFWKMAGDALEQKASEDRLKQLDVNYDGKAVFEPTTVVILSLTVVAASAFCTWIVVEKPTDGDFTKVLNETLKIVTSADLLVLAAL